MTTEITSGAGLRRLQIFLLDSTGVPSDDESGQDGYDGLRLQGVQGVTPNVPDVQPIQHQGDDRVFAQDFLPPTSLATMGINTGKANLTVDAALTGQKVEAVGDTEIGGFLTDKQGSEKDVLFMYYRQALNTDENSGSFGLRVWQQWMFPKSRIIPKGAGADQGAADQNSYNVIPTPTRQYPWEVAFTEANNGFTEALGLRIVSPNPVMLERWTGDASNNEFNLAWTPISTTKTKVWGDGTALTVSAVDTANKTMTLSTTPASGVTLVAWYETSDDIG